MYPYIAIFKLVSPFHHRIMHRKLSDDNSNGSEVIRQTDRQTDKHTDTTENNTTLTVWVVMTSQKHANTENILWETAMQECENIYRPLTSTRLNDAE